MGLTTLPDANCASSEEFSSSDGSVALCPFPLPDVIVCPDAPSEVFAGLPEPHAVTHNVIAITDKIRHNSFFIFSPFRYDSYSSQKTIQSSSKSFRTIQLQRASRTPGLLKYA